MRTLSATIKEVLAQDYGETKDVVIITIPAQVGATNYPETTLYLANGDGIFIDGIAYQNKLRSVSSIKFSLGKAPDSADISLENVSRSLGFTLTDFSRALDGAKVQIKRAFKTKNPALLNNEYWETDPIFTGYIRDVRVDQSTINISLDSDMSRRGTSVAGRPLTQRCILRFNVNGSGVGPVCGWKLGMTGNSLSCDKGLDTPNGCQAHGNTHRFGGVPSFTALDSSNGYDSNTSGWGQGSGGGWCISLDSWVLVDRNGNKCWIKAHSLVKNDILISIDKFGRFVPTRIIKATVGNTSILYSIITNKGYSLTSSPTHRVMKDYIYEEGVSVASLKEGDEVLIYNFATHTHEKDTILAVESIKRNSLVLLLELEVPNHLFIAGNEITGAIVSHNRKPAYTSGSDIGGVYDFWNPNNWGYVSPER